MNDNMSIRCVTCLFKSECVDCVSSPASSSTCNNCQKNFHHCTYYCCQECSLKLEKCYMCGNKINDYLYELYKLSQYVSTHKEEIIHRSNNYSEKLKNLDENYRNFVAYFWDTSSKQIREDISHPGLINFIKKIIYTDEEVEIYINDIRNSKMNKFKDSWNNFNSSLMNYFK